jgi:hypothetical protein
MKKILVAIMLLLVMLAGAGYYFYSNMEFLVKQQIETAGTAALGTAVTVDEVVIDLPTGAASIRGLRVANPEGFSAGSIMSFAELQVVLDINKLSRERIGIRSIIATSPHVLYELQGTASNLDVIRANVAAQAPAAETPASPGIEVQLDIARIDITEIGATLNSTALNGPVEVKLGDIALRDLSGTPKEIANQVMQPLLEQLSSNAARALLSARAGDLRDDVLDQVDASLEAAGETIRETSANIREGLSDLFNGDDDDNAPQPAPQQ